MQDMMKYYKIQNKQANNDLEKFYRDHYEVMEVAKKEFNLKAKRLNDGVQNHMIMNIYISLSWICLHGK